MKLHSLPPYDGLSQSYSAATQEIQDFYDGFEVYNFNDKFSPNKPIEEEEKRSTTLQQLLSISYTYAPTFFNNIKLQNMNYLRPCGP
eukprot:198346-Amphidinium_carterae.9